MIKVVVAGNFYPLHDGHIALFQEARKLGNVTAIIGSDNHLRLKGKPIHLSLPFRAKVVEPFVDRVFIAVDTDGTIARTLEIIKPDIYATGEDRTLDTLPENEIKICQELGIKIICGITQKIHSSSKILNDCSNNNG